MQVKAKRVGFGAGADEAPSSRVKARSEALRENAAHNLASENEVLNKAFLLAYFIHGNKEDAMQVVIGATAKLGVAASAQGKRLYYHPTGRPLPDRARSSGFRNKVLLNDLHLLQRLIYIESEPYEKRREQKAASVPLHREDLLVHFIKHLVRITVKRNSFYVTLGLSRLLYNYNTAETMEIYNVVVQDPERVKDDYYYRSRKGVLMNELKERFGNLVNTHRGARGEERFEAEESSGHYAELIEHCLSLFTPWNTICLVPAGFDPVVDTVPGLSYKSQNEEDKTEVDRMHTILHPDCYRRLIEALGFHTPIERLTVPHFFISHKGNESGGPRGDDRHAPPELNEEDLLAIKSSLDQQSARRRAHSAGLLRIFVDGIERSRLDLGHDRRTSFVVDDDAELIEVRRDAVDGEIMLASHLLTRNAAGDALEQFAASITLEGSQKLSIIISPSKDAGAHSPPSQPATVVVTYRETNPFRAGSLFLLQARFQLLALLTGQRRPLNAGELNFKNRTGFKALTLAATCALLLICAAAALLYLQQRGRPIEEAVVTGNGSPPAPAREESPTLASEPLNDSYYATATPLAPSGEQTEKRKASGAGEKKATVTPPQNSRSNASSLNDRPPQSNETTVRANPSIKEDATPQLNTPVERESTRDLSTGQKAVSLSEVKKIYVEMAGDDPLSQSVRLTLMNALRATGRFVLSGSRDEADALFRVSLDKTRPKFQRPGNRGTAVSPRVENRPSVKNVEVQRMSVVVRLINARGDVIWPVQGKNSSGRYEGSASEVAASITRGLLGEIQRPRR